MPTILQKSILVILLFFSLISCSEKPKEISYSTKEDKLLNRIEDNINRDFKKAEVYITELIDFAKLKKDTILIAKANLKRGIVFTKKGDYEGAIEVLERGIKLLENREAFELKNTILLRIGNAYVLYGNDTKAISYYTEVFEEAILKNNSNLLFKASVNIAKIKRNTGKYQEALDNYKKAYSQTKYLDIKKKNIARVLMGIGGTYLKMNEPDSTLFYSKKGLAISKEIDDKVGESYFYNDIGIAYFLKEDYNKALYNLSISKDFIKIIKNDERLAESLYYIAYCNYKLKKYNVAISYLEEIVLIVDQSKKINDSKFNPLEFIDTYKLLSKCYSAIGDEKLAYPFEKLSNKLQEIRNNKNNLIAKEISNSELYVHEEIINKIRLSNKSKIKKYWLLISIITILCIALTIILFYYRKKATSNKKMFDALISKHEKQKSKTNLKAKVIQINDKKIQEVLVQLERLEQKEYYLDVSCTLTTLSKKAKTNVTYLTKILREHKGKTFYQYINELRINYAINSIKSSKQFRQYDIKNIAKEVGYKSPESFTKHFKKATGIYPSYYIKEIKKLNSNV